MPDVQIIDDKTIKIGVQLADALNMVQTASQDPFRYAHDIVTIFEKMPEFDFTYFCFYAYDSAELFEKMLGIDPKEYNSFSLDAPDSFFYTIYGGMAGLYDTAKRAIASVQQ
ncbi:MAG: hypothetical protein K0R75_1833 [Paenibacillaceae bacterium]|jgi:hypothetical protein|nr:hypothetical protein [Paenibacillaceae bacterium]